MFRFECCIITSFAECIPNPLHPSSLLSTGLHELCQFPCMLSSFQLFGQGERQQVIGEREEWLLY